MLIFYIFSIAFQLSGSLLLLFFSLSINRKSIVYEFINKNNVYEDGNTGKLTYNEGEFKNTFKKAYLTRFSFGYITLGYILGIFGSLQTENRLIIAAFIATITFTLILLTYFIVNYKIKKDKSICLKITSQELKDISENPTITSISKSEIESIVNRN